MEMLPDHWLSAPLSEIAKVQGGGTPPRGISKYWNGKIPWVKISDIDSVYVEKTEEFITNEGLQNSSARIFPKGTILLTIFATIGRVGILKIDAATNQAVAGITPIKEVEEKFFYYSLVHYASKLINQGKGVAQKNINLTILKNLEIPLPPYSEQKLIATKLDELFASLDRIKTSFENIHRLIKQFRKTVLINAVTGRLTEEWRKGKQLNEWESMKLGDIIVSIEAGKNFACPEIPVSEGKVGLVKISAVTWDEFDPTETKTVEDPNLINPKYFIHKGDFLISRANTLELVGSSVIVKDIHYDIMLSDKVWRIDFGNDITKSYVNRFLKSPLGRKEIESRATGNQLSMRNLSQSNFRDIDISLPPIEEQEEILLRVDSLFSKANSILAQFNLQEKKIEKLPAAILTKAFQGKLIEQYAND